MKINIFQWRYSPFLMLLALWLPVDNAHAAKLVGVTCEAGLNAMPGSNGIVTLDPITPSNVNTVNTRVQLNYKCTQSGLSDGYVSLCFGVDGGSYNPGVISPRYLYKEAADPTKSRLAFNMTPQGTSLWGPLDSGNEYITAKIPIAGRNSSNGNNVIEGKIYIDIALAGLENTLATGGIYTNTFTNTALKYDGDTLSGFANCSSSLFPGRGKFPFTVQATVINECKINPTANVNLDSQPAATSTNVTSNTVIGVTCTKGTQYTIGLVPFNNRNQIGAGYMIGTGNNSDKINYQLWSTPILKWGNTATIPNENGGVIKRTSEGNLQNEAVYVTLPGSVDVKPDNYSDTVTIHVNY